MKVFKCYMVYRWDFTERVLINWNRYFRISSRHRYIKLKKCGKAPRKIYITIPYSSPKLQTNKFNCVFNFGYLMNFPNPKSLQLSSWFFYQQLFYSLSDQIRSVAQSCLTLCNPMNCSMPGLHVHHQLPEFTETHVHRVSDAIQPSHPLLSPSPPAPNPSQHQSLFQWVNSSHEVAKVLEFQL